MSNTHRLMLARTRVTTRIFDRAHMCVCVCVCVPHCTQRKDLEEAGAPLPKPLPTLYESISSDEEAVLKTIMHITSGITSIVDKVQK